MAGLDSFVKLYSNFNSTISDDYGGKTLTGNGSASISTSVKKFGAGSLLLASATSDFVSISDHADFDLGSGDFEIDLQVRFVSLPSASNRMCLFSSWNDTTDEGYMLSLYNNAGRYELEWKYTTDGSTEKTQNIDCNIVIDTFYHIAVCRDSTDIAIFLDGTNIGGYYIGTDTIHNSAEDFKLGAYNTTETDFLNGYIDEFRFSKGIARYTISSFTPPTVAFTNDANTSLLLHMDGSDDSTTFTDSSTSAHTMSANGDAKLKTSDSFSGKFGSAVAYFDGSSSTYLSIPDSTDWTFSNNDFTIDFWVNFKDVTTVQYVGLVDQRTSALPNYSFTIFMNYNKVNFSSRLLGVTTFTQAFSVDTWYHLAFVRNSTTITLYVNGTADATTISAGTTALDDSTETLKIGAYKQSTVQGFLNGYMDEIRISKNTARWTTNFTAPSSEYSSDANTQLLLHCNGSTGDTTFTDDGNTTHTVTANGNARLQGAYTISPVIGTAMGKFDGVGDSVTTADSSDFNFSNNNFAVEGYFSFSNFPNSGNYFGLSGQCYNGISNLSYLLTMYNNSGNHELIFAFSFNGTTQRSCLAKYQFSLNTWYHFSAFRISDTVYLAVEGKVLDSYFVSTTSLYNSSQILVVGARYKGFSGISEFLDGYIDELRISNGDGRYTPASFTPPITEYSTGDATAPTITDLNPESGDNKVLVSQNLSITYNENVTAVSSKYINIYDFYGTLFEQIEATNAKVTIVDNVVTINPTDNFSYGKIYYVLIDAGAFEDASSNGTDAVTDPAYWNFKTQSYDFDNTIIEINDEDYTDKAHMPSIKIVTQDNFSNSASLKIVDNSNFIEMGMELIIRDTVTSEILFGGLIQEPKKTLLSPEFMVLDIYAEGYKQIFGRRTFVVDAQNTTAGAIVDQTFTDFIKVGSSTSEELTEGNIATGATIENYVKPAEPAMKIYNDLANSSGFKWWVTNEKAFYFQAEPTYVDNTSTKVLTPDKTDAGYINCVDMPTFIEDSSKFRTRQFVVGKKLENGSVVGSYTDTTKETAMALIYGSGVFGSVLTNRNINNTSDANDMAETEVKTYVNPAKIKFKTYDKINVLELISVDISLLGISSETYKVTKVTKKIDSTLRILSTIECEKYVAATKQKRVWTDDFDEMLKSNNEKDEQKEVLYDEWTAGGTIVATTGSDVRTITAIIDTDLPLHTHYTIVGTCAGAGTVTIVVAIDATAKKTYTFDVVAGNFSKTLAYPIQAITTSGSSSITATTTTTVNLVIAAADLTFWVGSN